MACKGQGSRNEACKHVEGLVPTTKRIISNFADYLQLSWPLTPQWSQIGLTWNFTMKTCAAWHDALQLEMSPREVSFVGQRKIFAKRCCGDLSPSSVNSSLPFQVKSCSIGLSTVIVLHTTPCLPCKPGTMETFLDFHAGSTGLLWHRAGVVGIRDSPNGLSWGHEGHAQGENPSSQLAGKLLIQALIACMSMTFTSRVSVSCRRSNLLKN